jgi:hypothetical protein
VLATFSGNELILKSPQILKPVTVLVVLVHEKEFVIFPVGADDVPIRVLR